MAARLLEKAHRKVFDIEQATSKDGNANLDQQGSAVRITGLTSDQSLKEIFKF